MNAFFYDRNFKLHRCHFTGINEMGEPMWLLIEQGQTAVTLQAKGRPGEKDPQYKLLCIEGEQVRPATLLQMLSSYLKPQLDGFGEMYSGVSSLIREMMKKQVIWGKEIDYLDFDIRLDSFRAGKYSLCVGCGDYGDKQYIWEISDLEKLMEVLDDFICQLEECLNMDIAKITLKLDERIDQEAINVYLSVYDSVIID